MLELIWIILEKEKEQQLLDEKIKCFFEEKNCSSEKECSEKEEKCHFKKSCGGRWKKHGGCRRFKFPFSINDFSSLQDILSKFLSSDQLQSILNSFFKGENFKIDEIIVDIIKNKPQHEKKRWKTNS